MTSGRLRGLVDGRGTSAGITISRFSAMARRRSKSSVRAVRGTTGNRPAATRSHQAKICRKRASRDGAKSSCLSLRPWTMGGKDQCPLLSGSVGFRTASYHTSHMSHFISPISPMHLIGASPGRKAWDAWDAWDACGGMERMLPFMLCSAGMGEVDPVCRWVIGVAKKGQWKP